MKRKILRTSTKGVPSSRLAEGHCGSSTVSVDSFKGGVIQLVAQWRGAMPEKPQLCETGGPPGPSGVEELGRPRQPHKLEIVGSNPTPATLRPAQPAYESSQDGVGEVATARE